MRKAKKILFAACLFSFASFADFIGPLAPLTSEEPMQTNIAAAYSLPKLGIASSFIHNVGFDLEYGISAMGSMASFSNTVFTQKASKDTGIRFDVDAMIRYLPEISQDIFFGGLYTLGYSYLGKSAGSFYKNTMNFKLGPLVSYQFIKGFFAYSSLCFVMSDIRFGDYDKDPKMKEASNMIGTHLDLGGQFELTHDLGMFVSLTPKIPNLRKMNFAGEIAIGVNLALK